MSNNTVEYVRPYAHLTIDEKRAEVRRIMALGDERNSRHALADPDGEAVYFDNTPSALVITRGQAARAGTCIRSAAIQSLASGDFDMVLEALEVAEAIESQAFDSYDA